MNPKTLEPLRGAQDWSAVRLVASPDGGWVAGVGSDGRVLVASAAGQCFT